MNAQDFYSIFKRCTAVQIDSRKVKKNDIFFAFSGDNFNAAQLAESAIENGALAAIVELQEFENKEKNIYYVASTLQFLQELAIYHRSKIDIPIIGLTGSNGKTTTKELIHTVLSAKYNVLATEGNFNNHIGVPLTLLSIKPDHEIAVVEMGANHQKEIEFLCTLAKPTLGYITNFGKAHLEGFGGFEGVIKGKSEMYAYLMSENKTILINKSDQIQVEKTVDYKDVISFGTPNADYYFENYTENNLVGLEFLGQKLLSQLTGSYNFSNLSAAVALGLKYDIDFTSIKNAVELYVPTNMRSQILRKNDKTLVLDTYNANPSSMVESLKNFSSFAGSKTIIIGDMLELGNESETEHKEILNFAKNFSFNQIITVGREFQKANTGDLSFTNTQELIEYLQGNKIITENILLKASRGIALEKILDFID
ncbi:UDP-N-acetylmuramoyl-tripeptide--D-alanyl-D-alanine ligase [Frigoriflavimonas asaccharolytica]|uniref:UDP-N-acetylmuramoyl-tripeptide--D-alanyl-D-alanine ligase n=1 Tax=Frigoriflavimonas asaccharolytica TaxID=2735899 RepID=A0A8J8K970_9FLAO|nr:UDP-N-acetylmuramoyl-tripeptide--D-alanyl-D-alanine ligase [Frigoriflavimonas asaccharolytica]NRS93286.1 UDP-N-acetylmuramoyl-tripeptide--D-alanyl-D-alanine ligase [Frigoriflavimonas asaccharolytica]